MIPLISSGFTDKLCKAPDAYQRIRTTRVGGTEERGRKRKKDGGKVSWGGKEGGGGLTWTKWTDERVEEEVEGREAAARWVWSYLKWLHQSKRGREEGKKGAKPQGTKLWRLFTHALSSFYIN